MGEVIGVKTRLLCVKRKGVTVPRRSPGQRWEVHPAGREENYLSGRRGGGTVFCSLGCWMRPGLKTSLKAWVELHLDHPRGEAWILGCRRFKDDGAEIRIRTSQRYSESHNHEPPFNIIITHYGVAVLWRLQFGVVVGG